MVTHILVILLLVKANGGLIIHKSMEENFITIYMVLDQQSNNHIQSEKCTLVAIEPSNT